MFSKTRKKLEVNRWTDLNLIANIGDVDNSDEDVDDDENEEEKENDENEDENANAEEQRNLGSVKYVYDTFYSNNLNSVFPNLSTLLKISLILPVSSSSAERSFSKLRILKSRLWSTMMDMRLNSLMILSSEAEIQPDPNKIIDKFYKFSELLKNKLHV